MAGTENDKTKTTDGSASSSSSSYNSLPKDIKNYTLMPLLSIADIAKGMKHLNRESNSFFSNKTIYQKRLEVLGVQPAQIASLAPNTIEIIARQLEELKQNSPPAFKKIKQNYLDTGIPCSAIFSLQVNESALSPEERQHLADQAAEGNNVTLLSYLSSNERGAHKIPLQNATLAKAGHAGNLSLIKAMFDPEAMFDPAGGMMSMNNRRGGDVVTTMITLSQNFSVMQWVMETLVDEPGNPLLKQAIQENIPLDSDELIKAAVFGREHFYTQMSAFIKAHPNSFPKMAESLPVANYYNDLVNNGAIDDFNWITNTGDPRLADNNRDLFVIALFRANNLQLVSNFFAAAKSDNSDAFLRAPFAELSLMAFLPSALIYSSDPAILEFTYQKLLEEYQLSLPNSAEIINLDEEMRTSLGPGIHFDDYCLLAITEHGYNPDLFTKQMKILHIKPTIQQLATVLSDESYKVAEIMASDRMGENKVTVTRESLQEAFNEINRNSPSNEIIDKLFKFQADAPALGVS